MSNVISSESEFVKQLTENNTNGEYHVGFYLNSQPPAGKAFATGIGVIPDTETFALPLAGEQEGNPVGHPITSFFPKEKVDVTICILHKSDLIVRVAMNLEMKALEKCSSISASVFFDDYRLRLFGIKYDELVDFSHPSLFLTRQDLCIKQPNIQTPSLVNASIVDFSKVDTVEHLQYPRSSISILHGKPNVAEVVSYTHAVDPFFPSKVGREENKYAFLLSDKLLYEITQSVLSEEESIDELAIRLNRPTGYLVEVIEVLHRSQNIVGDTPVSLDPKDYLDSRDKYNIHGLIGLSEDPYGNAGYPSKLVKLFEKLELQSSFI